MIHIIWKYFYKPEAGCEENQCGDGGEGRVHSWIYDGICRWKEELSLVSRMTNEVFAHRNLEKCWVLEDVRMRLMNPRSKEEV
jgi:hypothetical protein